MSVLALAFKNIFFIFIILQERSWQHRCHGSGCQSAAYGIGWGGGPRSRFMGAGSHIQTRLDWPCPSSPGPFRRLSPLPPTGQGTFRSFFSSCFLCTCFYSIFSPFLFLIWFKYLKIFVFRFLQDERLDILKALSSKLHLPDDVRLDEIALETEHYSGADLQAVLYTAQLKAVHQLTQSKNPNNQSDWINRAVKKSIRRKTYRA